MKLNTIMLMTIVSLTTTNCAAKEYIVEPALMPAVAKTTSAPTELSVKSPKIITMNNTEYEVVLNEQTQEYRMIPVKNKLEPAVTKTTPANVESNFPRSSKFEEVCPDPAGCEYKDGKCIGCVIEEVPETTKPHLMVKDNENVYINTAPTTEHSPVVTKVEEPKPKEKSSLEGRYLRTSDEVVLWDGTPITKSTVSGGIIYEVKKLGFDIATRSQKYKVTLYGNGTVKYDDPEFPNFQSNTQCSNDPTVYIIVLNKSGKVVRKSYINNGWCEPMHYNNEFWKITDYGIVREREGRMSDCCHGVNTEFLEGPIQMTISYHLVKI